MRFPISVNHPREQIFAKAFRAIRPRAPLPEFQVRFRPYADVNHVIRLRDGRVEVGLSDLLEAAPPTVVEAIAFILLSKLYRKPIPKRYQTYYRQFLNRRHIRDRVHAIRRVRGRKWIGEPGGEHFHLEEIFDDLNEKYFNNLLGRPRLSWSRTASRTLLGHWDAAHNAIIVSKLFDRAGTPRYLVEYILYHEMLHLKYPVEHRRARRCVHSPAFREEERRFPHFTAAKYFLNSL
ncbi:MAG: M48 family peptidase [Acidobacteria bacterium]|nr:M48 family peptidase [Acidobacteriota bacterium]